MNENLGLIPQVFYDLLGRVVPGTVFLTSAVLLLAEAATIRAIAARVIALHPATISVLLLFSSLLAYVIGFILGAIGAVFSKDGLFQPSFERIHKTVPSPTASELTPDDIPYIYDFILVKDPPTGLRLAKLRAESHMCGALIVSCVLLALAYFSSKTNPIVTGRPYVITALVISAAAAVLFKRHLRTRALRLQINCWLILHDSTTNIGSADATTHPDA